MMFHVHRFGLQMSITFFTFHVKHHFLPSYLQILSDSHQLPPGHSLSRGLTSGLPFAMLFNSNQKKEPFLFFLTCLNYFLAIFNLLTTSSCSLSGMFMCDVSMHGRGVQFQQRHMPDAHKNNRIQIVGHNKTKTAQKTTTDRLGKQRNEFTFFNFQSPAMCWCESQRYKIASTAAVPVFWPASPNTQSCCVCQHGSQRYKIASIAAVPLYWSASPHTLYPIQFILC